MAYSNFTLEGVLSTFQLEKVESVGLFSESEPVTPRSYFTTELAKKVPLATAIGTEKARSELIVADVLFELREISEDRITLWTKLRRNNISVTNIEGHELKTLWRKNDSIKRQCK